MTVSYSQGFCEAQVGRQEVRVVSGTDITINANNITRTAADFLSAGFRAGDKVFIRGATTEANNKSATITAAADDTLTFADGTFTVEEIGATIYIIGADGGSFANLMNGGKLTFFNGSKPTNADQDKGGATALVEFDGVSFGDVSWDGTNLYAEVDLSATVNTTGLVDGSIGWWRMTARGHERDTASTEAIRMDGSIGVGTGDIRVGTLSVTSGGPNDLSSFKFMISQS